MPPVEPMIEILGLEDMMELRQVFLKEVCHEMDVG